MANRTKVTGAEVLNFLTTGKKSIQDVAKNFTVTTATARKHLIALVGLGNAKKDGSAPKTGQRGRSPELYSALAGATVVVPSATTSSVVSAAPVAPSTQPNV